MTSSIVGRNRFWWILASLASGGAGMGYYDDDEGETVVILSISCEACQFSIAGWVRSLGNDLVRLLLLLLLLLLCWT